MNYKKGLFIFRRDLRLDDNTALLQALHECETVIPCFILDPCQVSETNKFRSSNALQFMFESLDDLAGQLISKGGQLFLFHGDSKEVIEKILQDHDIDAVYCNKDYTTFSLERDAKIEKVCAHLGRKFVSCSDLLLNDPNSIKTGNNEPFSVYTPFYKKSIQFPIALPRKNNNHNYYKGSIKSTISPTVFKSYLPNYNEVIAVQGGTSNALKKLKNLAPFQDYAKLRDFPAIQTTRLSAHNKFGTVSIRHVYDAIATQLGPNHGLIRQLYWRDFFTSIAYFSPFVFGHAFHKKFEHVPWEYNKQNLARWSEGQTGFPMVDAGMREINETGFMHNRLRMVVGSFLTKDLHMSWQVGEKYFAQHLADYDPCVNNGSWQWVASTGADGQPYFRIFNPWLQQKKFDPECRYIKQWIPELRNYSAATIHEWQEQKAPSSYPKPMLDHRVESEKTKKLFLENIS